MINLSKQAKTDLVGYSFILPNIIGTMLFVLLPLVFSLVISFTDWDFVSGFDNIRFTVGENYGKLWSDTWFLASLKNTLIYAVTVVPLTVLIALVLAVLIEKYAYAKTPVKLAAFMPYISNIVAVSIVWKMMYTPWGPFTQLVKNLGWENPPAWLGNYTWALPAIIMVGIWGGIGYCILIYSSAIQALPQDVYEAADVDGAGPIRQFFQITIPGLSPTTFFLIITQSVQAFQIFAQVQIMTKGGPGTTTHVLVYYIYTSAFAFYKMGYASAIAWVLFLLLMIITLIQWQGQKRWVNYQ